MAISDANYCFLYVEIGQNGSKSDGGIFSRSKLQPMVTNGTLGIPPDAFLDGLQPVLTGNTTVSTAQSSSIQSGATSQFEERHQERIFYYRLSRARRVVENSFGILAQKWGILRRPFKAKEENITKIVSACVALHNLLLKESPASRNMYCPPGTTDSEDWRGNRTDRSWRTKGVVNGALTALAGTGGNSARHAHAIRDKLRRHFIIQCHGR
ncbi:hypothetical protein MRX96_006757 [Rhipicephalus microplus]|nr:uncharacterized protein LOC119175725 [Rhipicephalus microplus]